MTATERPERIYQARRAATFRRLVDAEGIPEHDAEDWISRWEEQAALLGVGRYSAEFWADGAIWIAEQRAAERSGRRL